MIHVLKRFFLHLLIEKERNEAFHELFLLPFPPRNFLENKSIIPNKSTFCQKVNTENWSCKLMNVDKKGKNNFQNDFYFLFFCLNAVCEMLLNVVICVLYGNIVYNAQHFTLVMR